MNQSAEDVPSTDGPKSPWLHLAMLNRFRGLELQPSMGPGSVVVLGVRPDHTVQMSSPTDERPVQALGSDRPDPPLRERVRPRRPVWGADNLDAFGPEHLVEGPRVLGITIVDQGGGLFERAVDHEVAGLLGHPRRVRVLGHPGDVDLPGGKLDEEQDVQGLQPDGLDGEEVGGENAVSLGPKELRPGGTPIGGEPARCRWPSGSV
jgi:hypothetical protein